MDNRETIDGQNKNGPSSSFSSSSSSAFSLEGSKSGSSLTHYEVFSGPRTPGLMGKHRLAAAISYLNHQIQIIQEELDEVENLDKPSVVCRELISSVESVPDALIPITKGPAEVGWERWFQASHGSRNRRRWI